MRSRILLFVMMLSVSALAQVPPIEPGVSQELAEWRAARYSNVRYKLNLTLEKMSPVLKGSMEIRVNVSEPPASAGGQKVERHIPPIVLDWRKIKGHEEKSMVSKVSVNGRPISLSTNWPPANAGGSDFSEHLIFSDGVVMGENVIKLDFTSPILTSGSAITRYVDKEDGSEYLYSLFVPSDASTAFPVFDQPDIKARFSLDVNSPKEWRVVSNNQGNGYVEHVSAVKVEGQPFTGGTFYGTKFPETNPISTYVFAFAAGPFERVEDAAQRSVPPAVAGGLTRPINNASGSKLTFLTETGSRDAVYVGGSTNSIQPPATAGGTDIGGAIYVRKSQAAKFKPHAAEVFRLNREAVKYFEEYFNYNFPFSKYDLVLIPEFPFGGMEHAGATFLREASIIFPQEPTKNDHISRATLIFHEAAHQWFGDTVTMRWFDDLWLKEGFATFTAYKAMERVMPEMNAWKVFYERVKQAAHQTDSTKGTTAIYQPIANLSAAKSAYGNIVYNKAPAFLRQAEFYLGEDKFQAAVRAFLKKHEFGNAGWEDLVREFETASKQNLTEWARQWVTQRGMPIFESKVTFPEKNRVAILFTPRDMLNEGRVWSLGTQWGIYPMSSYPHRMQINATRNSMGPMEIRTGSDDADLDFGYFFPNYGDYGYGIFLLDDKSRDYVLKNIQNEKDPFLRSMMWGALWDSVREGELDPREYVELVVRVLMHKPDREGGRNNQVGSTALTDVRASAIDDESTTALLLNRVGTAMNYYIDERPVVGGTPTAPVGRATGGVLGSRVEDMLIAGMRNAETLGQRITYYRAFLNIASSEKAQGVLKQMLTTPSAEAAATPPSKGGESRIPSTAETPRRGENTGQRDAGRSSQALPLKTKDKFDLVTKLLILGDPEAPRLLAELEKTETSDDAKRYAYAARAGIPTAENKAKYWNDFVNNKEISESWIEAAFGPWNSIRHSELTLPYLERALKELPNHKRNRKIFFVNGWLGAFIGGQRSEEALAVVNKFLADNPGLDNDLRLKILENVDVIERAVRIRTKFK